MRRTVTFAITMALLVLPAATLAAYEGGPVTDGGKVSGRILFQGAVPTAERMPVTQDQNICGEEPKASEALVVSASGGLQSAVVWLDGITRGKPLPAEPRAEINNTTCRFEPHVQGAIVGSRIDVKNSDDVLHNTHARQGTDRLTVFNVGLPIQGQVSRQRLKRPGLVKVGCDAGHTWMSAFIYVFEHPYYAVTDADGNFSITDIPAGKYTVQIWHETLGTKSAEVTITPAGAATLEIPFSK